MAVIRALGHRFHELFGQILRQRAVHPVVNPFRVFPAAAAEGNRARSSRATRISRLACSALTQYQAHPQFLLAAGD